MPVKHLFLDGFPGFPIEHVDSTHIKQFVAASKWCFNPHQTVRLTQQMAVSENRGPANHPQTICFIHGWLNRGPPIWETPMVLQPHQTLRWTPESLLVPPPHFQPRGSHGIGLGVGGFSLLGSAGLINYDVMVICSCIRFHSGAPRHTVRVTMRVAVTYPWVCGSGAST